MPSDERSGTPASSTSSDDAAQLRSILDDIIGRHPSVGLAIGVVRHGHPPAFATHGVADVTTGIPVTPDTVFRIASITKTLTAIAVMQLWERGAVDLDAPAHEYLRAYRLLPARPDHPAATVRHLLTHTAGLPELAHLRGVLMPDFGESVPAGRSIPSLAEFYGGELRLRAAPGTRFVYGNHSPATLGQLVEDVTGEPLDRYLRDRLFEPLGMDDTDLGRSRRVTSRLATGYEIGSRGVKAVPFRAMVTAGAASVCSTPRDMGRYLAALLAGGAGSRSRILQPDTVAMMFEAQYRPDPRIPGIGLAFFRKRVGDHVVVGHQGTLPGFHSQVLLVPATGVAAMIFTNGGRQPDFWLPTETEHLLRTSLGGPAEMARPGVLPQRDGKNDLCGWYRLDAGLGDVRLRSMMGAGVEISGPPQRQVLRFLTPIPSLARGFPLLPDDPVDPDVYRIDLPGDTPMPMRVVVGRSADGAAARLHLDLMPLTLRKQPASTNPRRWVTGAVAATAIAAAARLLCGTRSADG
jgi:CubicO group peptidase (beta-lactamase class C family)